VKPSLFIMSSGKLGLPIAEALRLLISESGEIEVTVWADDQAFEPGAPFVTMLRRSVLIYDFGIIVLTPDDTTLRKDVDANIPRDNTLFELGLFLGARGPTRAFPLAVQLGRVRPDLPSDLLGVKMDRLELAQPIAEALHSPASGTGRDQLVAQVAALTSVKSKAEDFRSRLVKFSQKPALGILPSTGLAIGYLHNFVIPTLSSLTRFPELLVRHDGKEEVMKVDLTRFKLRIWIPEDLRNATREQWAQIADSQRMAVAQVNLPRDSELPRSYPFRLQIVESNGAIIAYDLPTTLYTTFHVVREMLNDIATSSEPEAEMALAVELNNFVTALKFLLARHSMDGIRHLVEITTDPL